MAISKSITWNTLSVTGAVLRITNVWIGNDPSKKVVSIHYKVFASASAYAAGNEPLYEGELTLDTVATPTEFAAWKTNMEQSGNNVISASYIAVKQLATWTSASDENLGDE